MKKLHLLNGQKGAALIVLLIVLAVIGLILPPALSLGVSGIKIEKLVESRTTQLYAADVGVQQVLWWLKTITYSNLPSTTGTFVEFPPADVTTIGNERVFAFLEYVDKVSLTSRFRITSLAGPGVIHDHVLNNQPSDYTKIVSYVTTDSGDFSGIMNQVITSQTGYTIQGGQSSVSPPVGDPNGPGSNYSGPWPTQQQLHDYYWEQVKNATPYGSASINAATVPTLGPLYRDGSLDIESGTSGVTVKLTGTLFVNGSLLIGQTGQSFTLDMNDQTIYVNKSGGGALQLGTKVTVKGSGAFIAIGDISFMPGISSAPTDFLLMLSVSGQSYIKPNGEFHGTIAGNSVYDQNAVIRWVNPTGKGVNLPGVGSGTFWGIDAWDISTH